MATCDGFRILSSLLILSALALGGCGDDGRISGDRDSGPGGPCSEGTLSCRGLELYACVGGDEVLQETCELGSACVDGLGCRDCIPDRDFCDGQEIRTCGADGMSSELVRECPPSEVCSSGVCVDACENAAMERSNVGCDYMVVDLDNEFSQGPLGDPFGGGVPPAQQQFAIVLANTSNVPVLASVYQSNGQPNAPAEALLGDYNVPPNDLIRIDLPAREVDGSTADTEGPGTMLTNNAYRVRTNFPVVAYQFNPIIESASNDASLLLPVPALDNDYRVIGWPTANPIEIEGFPDMPGLPDHSYVTIVGTQPNTVVTVTLGGPIIGGEIQGGGTIEAASAGETIEYTIGPYDVLNLESTDIPGDMTGTVVSATAPVAVFSGGERAIAPIGDGVSQHPDWEERDGRCCTEHVEEQVFPTTAWGQDFVITRSPVRSNHATWKEPDIYRVMADKDGTTVTTNLPSPNDSFTLNENEWREFSTDRSFVMNASEAVSIQQMLVSQNWVHRYKSGHGGDPSMILYPPYEQYRDDYLFLVPDTFSSNYVVLSVPTGTTVFLDGGDIAGDEFMRLCEYEEAGMIDGETYTAVTCPVDGGTHTIESTRPVGIMVYGYHSVGSYGYAGGSNLTRINLI